MLRVQNEGALRTMPVCQSCQTLNSQQTLKEANVGALVAALDPATTVPAENGVPVEVCAICGGPLLDALATPEV